MAWDRAKLMLVVGDRLAKRTELEPVERAALAYARWQGLTDEPGEDREAAKRALDRSLEDLDQLGPGGWKKLASLADELGDNVIVGLMQHSMQRGLDQVREPLAVGEPETDGEADVDIGTHDVVPEKRRRRDRDR
jgi:hypothetical protein